jgi:hypothetical protein
MTITLQLGCVGLLILSWLFFFGAPIVTSAMAVVCSTGAVISLTRSTEAKSRA